MVSFVLAGILLYILRTAFIFIGLEREKSKKSFPKDILPFVSVIVPAKDEEHNISESIFSIVASDYPQDRFEIIAVNDRSQDDTYRVLTELSHQVPNLKIISISSDNEKTIKGKAGALQKGFDMARGEIIMMTDADCKVHPKWISTFVNAFDEKIGLIGSFTLVEDRDSAFADFQALEWLMLHAMAGAGVGWNIALGCFGNNLAISREALAATGGYKQIRFSVTEDLALQQAVSKAGFKLRYLYDPESTVTTKPVDTIAEFIRQVKRWAIGGLKLKFKAAIFVVTSIMMWLGIVVSLIAGNWVWLVALIFVRVFGDYAILKPAMERMNRHNLAPMLIPSFFLFMLLELIVPFLLIRKKVVWKGQVFR